MIRLRDLSDTAQGKTAVVVGSGPSILQSPLHLLRERSTLVLGAGRAWKANNLPRLTFAVLMDGRVARAAIEDAERLKDLCTILVPSMRLEMDYGREFDEAGLVCRAPWAGTGTPYPLSPLSPAERTALAGKNTVALPTLHLAVLLGVERIVLVGFDLKLAPSGARRFFPPSPEEERADFSAAADLDGMLKYFDAFYEEWKDEVELVNASNVSALESWPRLGLPEALSGEKP